MIHHEEEPETSPIQEESPQRLLQESVIEETEEEEHENSPAIASDPEAHLREEGRHY